MLQVIITGAAGKMGREAVKAVCASPDLTLIGATTQRSGLTQDAGTYAGIGPVGIPLVAQLNELIPSKSATSTVLVDLTHGEHAYRHALLALEHQIPVVIGATGLTPTQISHLQQQSQQQQCGVILAPNFALGAILMMKFAQQAARYYTHTEIIEMHHDRKKDAPSGTAIKTAHLMAESRQEQEPVGPPVAARGEWVAHTPIHSIRLPGMIAHQEVIFGAMGEILTIRHDTMSREAFMPGLLLCIRKVPEIHTFIYGLEHLI